MMQPSQPFTYCADCRIEEITDFIADSVEPADFPQAILRFRNDKAAAEIGLEGLSDAAWVDHFGRFRPLPDNLPQPLALRYHGHQFRVYNPEIGDGRGFLFAQMRDRDNRLIDLGTKGSGQTPYSRFGDGRLTLKGAVREILATEMLQALGVETSRTFSVIETGEDLHRGDEPSPTRSAVLVRMSHGHIRIGSFQRLATLNDAENLRRLTAYCLRHYYNADAGDDAPAVLLRRVVASTARMAARFMMAGFVHGVLNSDNINISGESFDYGPWRWTPRFDGAFTAAYFDEAGLYAFGRQAEAIHWDVAQLAISLTQISAQEPLVEALNSFGDVYGAELMRAMLWRLGFAARDRASDIETVNAIEAALASSGMPIDRFFHDWMGNPNPSGYDDPACDRLRAALAQARVSRTRNHAYWQDLEPCSMHIDEVEAIWAPIAQSDDWSRLEAKISRIRRMGDALSMEAIAFPSQTAR